MLPKSRKHATPDSQYRKGHATGRDLNPAARRVIAHLVVNSSPLDAIVGLGTIFVGTTDRVFAPSIGTLGYRGPHCEKLKQVRWRPGFIRMGYWGGYNPASAGRVAGAR